MVRGAERHSAGYAHVLPQCSRRMLPTLPAAPVISTRGPSSWAIGVSVCVGGGLVSASRERSSQNQRFQGKNGIF